MKRNRFWASLAIGMVALAAPAGAARASEPTQNPAPVMNQPQGPLDAGRPDASEPPMAEVAGVRIVPSIVAHDVVLTPSPWYLRAKGNTASASARVYTDRQGAITGLTLTAWGLPNPESISELDDTYVVWLLNPSTNDMKNIGTLDSFNGGKAVFGYEPEQPLVGFSRIVITPERAMGTKWPEGWQQLDGTITQAAALPVMPPAAPMAPDAPQAPPPAPDEPMPSD